jgi:hypothetical protein
MLCQVESPSDWDWNSSYWRNLGSPWGGAHSTVSDVAQFLMIAVKYFFVLGTTKNPFSLSEHSRSRAVGMWETRERFPRAVESGICFPSVRHFHGRLG